MNRFFTLAIIGILLVALPSFLAEDVTVQINLPDTIEAGTEVRVDVVIDKGAVTGFARFQQDLPYGMTARAVNSANADFSFQDRKVRLIWLKLPAEDQLTFSYIITVNERLTGKTDLNGRFSYIENNERQSVDLQPQLLAINPSPNVDPSMIVDIHDYARLAASDPPAGATQAACIRQEPVWMQNEQVFLVTLLVNKDAVKKFAKIEENIPAGYTAENIDSKNGIFTYKDQVARFIWMNLPADPYFTVTYKLVPDRGYTANPSDMHITGAFSYMVGDKTETANVVERPEGLIGLNQNAVDNILKSITAGTAKKPVLAANRPTYPPQGSPAVKTSPAAASSTNNKNGNSTGELLKPEPGIYYRIQIAAGHRPVNVQRYFKKYRLDYSVMKEQHDGWIKYSIGSFPEYKDARDYRIRLSNTALAYNTFIAAYNNGKRITVQEALMASNQKWYK
jgi:hypothetical protein